ncbi:polycomb group protein ASXL1 isoform X1 [Phascolarctos cinereus]|uniref:Polycomb group protein ASXL1 isoform X1 n=1 Tax=Phascolarctos cinereus TaxID=38626 RepID=A0A6P5KNS7_PHACI|nr:putative Polycomb group protein ASXL1 isoform X1 [Phascolarctos cinereus]
MKDKQKRKKERTWAEAARLVLENYSDAPMTPKQILQVIEAEGLKEMSGTSPLACLNAMLHSNSRGGEGLFYKLPGRISLFTLKKDALQWSRNPSVPEGEELEDTADVESCGSNEASTVSGDNDVSLDETSSNASCSTESQGRTISAARETYRAASQTSKPKKKTGVMLPRVVLTPLKVNGAHMESASGFSGRHADGESSSTSSSSSSSLALCSTAMRNRVEITRDPPQILRGIRKPATGQMKRNRGEEIDFETPGSILVNTNLRALINSRTFNALPSHFQQQLLFLLPEVDRQVGTDGLMRLSSSALNNEFFTHAAQSWRERLADGEFTHEMQVRIRQEMEKEKKVEQWKEKFFEDYYGQKLGLTREESLQQNSSQEEADLKGGLCVPGEAMRPQRSPATRQRDGHFKKRSRPDLRCRARRSLYKKHEPEQTEGTKEIPPVVPDSSLYKEEKAETDLTEGSSSCLPGVSSTELKPDAPETPIVTMTARIQNSPEVLALASTSLSRIPSLPQENTDQEAKDQKRKSFEQASASSFPEKKPRLEDRQSFRNTIESVHPEKPQPTKEEPKVPPIRIQLSRIKPPWVVKGQPAYQICPRIVPNTEHSSRGRTGARTLADIKARALQARAQREAATASIGGGGGPGGGGGGNTDEGGGGGEASDHPEHRGAKRTHGRCAPDLQRTQLLPPDHVIEGEQALLETETPEGDWLLAGKDDLSSPPIGEEGCMFHRVTHILTSESEEALLPLTVVSHGQQNDAVDQPSSDTLVHDRLSEKSDLPTDVRTEHESCTTSQKEKSEEQGQMVLSENDSVQSQVGEVVLEIADQALSLDSNSTVKDPVHSLVSSLIPELLLDERQQDGPLNEVVLNDCSPPTRESSASQENLRGEALVADSVAPWLSGPVNVQAVQQQELDSRGSTSSPEPHNGSDPEKKVTTETLDLLGCLPATQDSINPSDNLPQLWELSTQGDMASVCKQIGEVQRLKMNGDCEALSTHSESTDTASDLEAELTEDTAETDPNPGLQASTEEAVGQGSPVGSMSEKWDWNQSDSLKTNGEPCKADSPLVTAVDKGLELQSWVSHVSGPLKPTESLPQVSSEKQLGSPCLARPVSSVEATNPLVMQLLQGNLTLEKVLPAAHVTTKLEAMQPLSENMEQSSNGSFGESTLDPETNRNVAGRNSSSSNSSSSSPRALRDVLTQECHNPGAVLPMPKGIQALPGTPPKNSKVVPNSGSPQPSANLVTSSGKLEEVKSKEKFSSCNFEEQKELTISPSLPQTSNVESTLSKSPGKQTTPRIPRFLSPNVISIGPNQICGAPMDKNYVGGQGKKLFGSGFLGSTAVALHHSRSVEPLPPNIPTVEPVFPSRKPGLNKSTVSGGGGVQTSRAEWSPKQPPNSFSSIKNENMLACGGGPPKSNAENRKAVGHTPFELMEHFQGMPLVMDLPFFKLPREPGKGLSQPLEPSSIPSQLNIKQAFYGKLSKLQLNSTSFNYSSSTPAFPRSLAGSVMQLSHKANFAANHSASLSVQMFTDSSNMEEISLKCSCSLKAMIMCKGCGAFCHDDCIGPSKLCVLCLVVR